MAGRRVGGADVDEALTRLDDWVAEHQRVTALINAQAEQQKGTDDQRRPPSTDRR